MKSRIARSSAALFLAVSLSWLCSACSSHHTSRPQAGPFVIAASPSLRAPIEALAQAFETEHPEVRVPVSYESGLEMRRTIAQLENEVDKIRNQSPVHIIAPGGDEVITRLAHKQYVIPETRTVYAIRPLVLVVPESLVDAPTSFESLAQMPQFRVAVADPVITPLGQETDDCLRSMGLAPVLEARLDVALDARSVLDHVLRGDADAGILFGPDAVQERDRIRVVAVAPIDHHRPRIFSMAIERSCPNRSLCAEFLVFVRTSAAQHLLRQLGYGVPQ